MEENHKVFTYHILDRLLAENLPKAYVILITVLQFVCPHTQLNLACILGLDYFKTTSEKESENGYNKY